jgi:dTDP-glucose 4,6-dehydratase
VEDCVDGVLATLDAPLPTVRGKTLNLGTGVATSVAAIADLVLEAAGRPTLEKKAVGERPGQVLLHVADARRAREALAWVPRTTLRDGIARTYRWYAENRAWWEPLRWMRHVRVRTPEGRVELH